MGTVEDPKYLKLNIDMEGMVATIIKGLLWEFTYVFAWNYKELKRIPPHIMKHKIELNITIPPSHQAHYYMNPNYAVVIKQYLDKLLAIGFIKPIEQVIWLWPIVVVPKKNEKLRICIDFWKLNVATTKKTLPITLSEGSFGQGNRSWSVSIFGWFFYIPSNSNCPQGLL
jgi:hypothetical protein